MKSSNLAASFSRRKFIKTVAYTTAVSSLLEKVSSNLVAGEASLLSTSTTGVLRIKLADFPVLQNALGSVRLAVNPINGNTGPNGSFYPVIINRDNNNAFFALNSRCTHQNCVVEALDASSSRMTCFCHGSVFGVDGRRLSGPASSSLTKYTVAVEGSEALAINIPGLGYSVTVAPAVAPAGAKPRLSLSFRTFRNVEYEVLLRPGVGQPATPVPFATTADGAIERTSYVAPTAVNTSFFVEPQGSAGLYSVAVRLQEV